jgi:hypothetical protein
MELETTGTLAGHYADGLGHTNPADACDCRDRLFLDLRDAYQEAEDAFLGYVDQGGNYPY